MFSCVCRTTGEPDCVHGLPCKGKVDPEALERDIDAVVTLLREREAR